MTDNTFRQHQITETEREVTDNTFRQHAVHINVLAVEDLLQLVLVPLLLRQLLPFVLVAVCTQPQHSLSANCSLLLHHIVIIIMDT